MNAEDYISVLKEILEITEEIEIICKNKKFDDIDIHFNKRDALFEKLKTPPEEITREQFGIIKNLKNSISKKNTFITKSFKIYKDELKLEIALSYKENKMIEAYKINSFSNKNSIFDIKE